MISRCNDRTLVEWRVFRIIATTSNSTAFGMRVISRTLPAPTLISPGRLSHRLLAQRGREDEARTRYRWRDVLADLPVSVTEVLATEPPSKTCSACGRTYALAYTMIGWMHRARRVVARQNEAHPGWDGGGAV